MENNYETIKNKFGRPLKTRKLSFEERIIEKKIKDIINNLNFRGISWYSNSNHK